MEVICDNKKLIYSNRICCINNDSIALKIDVAKETPLEIKFDFIYTDGELNTEGTSPENGKILFKLTNYNNPLGSGLKEPVEIGELNGKKLYIIFCVYRVNEDTFPILDISLYVEV